MAPGTAAVKNSFRGGVLEKSAVESIRCTIVSFLPAGHGRMPAAYPAGGPSGPKKRPVIANTITERTRHLIRLIQGDEASPLAYCDTQPSDEILLFFCTGTARPGTRYRAYCSRNQRKVKRPAGGKIWRFGLWCVIV